MAITPLQSRIEAILSGNTNKTPHLSRIESLLVDLIEFIQTGMSSVFHYKGSVATYADLQNVSNPAVGDVYNVQADGMDYAWDGTAWDNLGSIITIATEITSDGQSPVTSQAIYNALAGKVDTVSGKGLSTEDYTTAEKTKLSGIADGAEANVQSNWNETDTSSDAYVANKPTLGIAAAKGVDNTPTANSTNLVESGGVKTALDGKLPTSFAWTGTAAQYAQLQTDDYDLYFIEEASSLSMKG